MQTEPLCQLSSSPCFSSYSSQTFSQKIAARVIHELRIDPISSINDSWEQNDNIDVGDDFEFAFLSTDPNSSPVSADDIFHNGQIRPTYPLFDRTLLNDVASVSHISTINGEMAPQRRRLPLRKLMFETEDDENGLAAGTYCVWTPPCKKSSSTSKRWKLRDLLLRSHGDGKKKHSSADNGGAGAAKEVGLLGNKSGLGGSEFATILKPKLA